MRVCFPEPSYGKSEPFPLATFILFCPEPWFVRLVLGCRRHPLWKGKQNTVIIFSLLYFIVSCSIFQLRLHLWWSFQAFDQSLCSCPGFYSSRWGTGTKQLVQRHNEVLLSRTEIRYQVFPTPDLVFCIFIHCHCRLRSRESIDYFPFSSACTQVTHLTFLKPHDCSHPFSLHVTARGPWGPVTEATRFTNAVILSRGGSRPAVPMASFQCGRGCQRCLGCAGHAGNSTQNAHCSNNEGGL